MPGLGDTRLRAACGKNFMAYSKNFGNAYHVANSNWQSIHNPITEAIITSGNDISIENNDDDVYYNKISTKSETRCLRDFHNLYVKNVLIEKVRLGCVEIVW